MKIELASIDTEQFLVNEHVFNGEVVYLVIPKQIGAKWTKETKIFRSSVWNSDGELISASFPKFVNWGETPGVFPVPTSLNGCVVMEKIDGSTLIVSKYKGQYMIRTRGTIDATTMEKNGDEIQLFKETILPKLDKLMDYADTWKESVIFEWTSPRNQIVINYGNEPKFFLIGSIHHSYYTLANQIALDDVAKCEGFLRPNIYTFTTITDLISNVELWEGKEGVVVYSKNGQELHKCKSFSYLKLHRFKSNATFENTIDLFFEFGMPSYEQFQYKLIEKFDYECFQLVQGYISIICDGYKEVNKIVQGMEHFVEDKLKKLPNRREQAATVFASYGKESNRSKFIFTLLDGKSLDKEKLKRLLYQVTKS